MMRKQLALIMICLGGSAFAQPANDACSDATQLCPNVTLNGTTTAATTDAATEILSCYTPSATVWYKFTTNASGGNVTIHFKNLTFNPDVTKGQRLEYNVYEMPTPCDHASDPYVPFVFCGNTTGDADITTFAPCAANTTYYVEVNGSIFGAIDPAECDFEISISGPGIDQPSPTVSISMTNTDFCQGTDEPVDVTVIGCDDTVQFDWLYDGSIIQSSSIDTFSTTILSSPGDLQLVITCGTTCLEDDTSNAITLNVTPISADAGPDKFIGEGQSAVIEGSGEGTPEWTPGTDLTSTTDWTPTATPAVTTTYFLTVTNGSCTATDEMNVIVGEVITIYGGFTPNDDGINDKWVIGNSSNFPNMEVVIYDRSGQRVFRATNYDTPDKWWDGTYKGKPLPASTYYYVIDLKTGGEEDIFKGMVSILR